MSHGSGPVGGVRRPQRGEIDQAKKPAPAKNISFDFTIKCQTSNITKAIKIPRSELQGAYLADRTVEGVRRGRLKGQDNLLFPVEISFEDLLGEVGENLVGNVEEALELFAKFVAGLSRKGKYYQVIAELENLAHMKSCVDEMLKADGLNFNPDFVARVLMQRLNIAMFGYFRGEEFAVSEGQYKPDCMWDFGPKKSVVKLAGNYSSDGELDSEAEEEDEETTNNFSVLRGDGAGIYTMPDEQTTPCLSARCRQYLRSISGSVDVSGSDSLPATVRSDVVGMLEACKSEDFIGSCGVDGAAQCIPQICGVIQKIIDAKVPERISAWTVFDAKTDLSGVPPILAVILGIQFGQIYQGSWNDFTVAAKKYIALNSNEPADDFYWQEGTEIDEDDDDEEDLSLRAFGGLIDKLYPDLGNEESEEDEEEDSDKRLEVAQEFEKGVLAYYAMTQEILSRTDFDSNNRSECKMESIFRLESLESLEDLGIVTRGEGESEEEEENPYVAHNIPANSKHAAIVSSSARMHVTSLDKPKDFPPPIKVITRYKEVRHARVFGCHLFNFDFGNAVRELPPFLSKDKDSPTVAKYDNGGPFFRDRQREFLIMPTWLTSDVVGVLAFAPDHKNCFVLATDDPFDGTLEEPSEAIQGELEEESEPESGIGKARKSQINFCNGENSAEDWLFGHLLEANGSVRKSYMEAGQKKKKDDRKVALDEVRQVALEDHDGELKKLQDCQQMLVAINEEFGFKTLYKVN
jgi:hypothetical protein